MPGAGTDQLGPRAEEGGAKNVYNAGITSWQERRAACVYTDMVHALLILVMIVHTYLLIHFCNM